MTQSQRIAVCILRHLKDELNDERISAEKKESLEVAIQCLESVYELGADEINSLAVSASLQEMFKASTASERMCFKPAQSAKPKEPIPAAEEFKVKGNEFLKAEKYTEAVQSYSQAIDLDPENAVYFCNRAAAFSKLDKSAESIADCEAALAIDPGYSKAYGRMGFAYASAGDHQKALDCYQKAMDLDPNNESYKNNYKVAKEQLETITGMPTMANGAGLGGLGGDMPAGFSDFMRNPALVNMATNIMQDPDMQNLMSNLMSSTMNAGQESQTAQPGVGSAPGGAPGGVSIESLLRAGQQFAQHMQQSNAPLIDQLRREMETRGVNPPNNNPDNNQQNQ